MSCEYRRFCAAIFACVLLVYFSEVSACKLEPVVCAFRSSAQQHSFWMLLSVVFACSDGLFHTEATNRCIHALAVALALLADNVCLVACCAVDTRDEHLEPSNGRTCEASCRLGATTSPASSARFSSTKHTLRSQFSFPLRMPTLCKWTKLFGNYFSPVATLLAKYESSSPRGTPSVYKYSRQYCSPQQHLMALSERRFLTPWL